MQKHALQDLANKLKTFLFSLLQVSVLRSKTNNNPPRQMQPCEASSITTSTDSTLSSRGPQTRPIFRTQNLGTHSSNEKHGRHACFSLRFLAALHLKKITVREDANSHVRVMFALWAAAENCGLKSHMLQQQSHSHFTTCAFTATTSLLPIFKPLREDNGLLAPVWRKTAQKHARLMFSLAVCNPGVGLWGVELSLLPPNPNEAAKVGPGAGI